MTRPADHASDREGRREKVGRQADAVQQEGGVELDVGVEPAIGLALAQEPQRHAFDVFREVVERSIAIAPIEALRRARRARRRAGRARDRPGVRNPSGARRDRALPR